ncbi:MAG: hypothetical protein PHX54_10460 [Lentimicrobiaceae bacterium]|nr:hypothetical protein [Lentimicrobiaceae bacterium]
MNEKSDIEKTASIEKYKKSGVRKKVAAEWYEKLLKTMVEEKPYLDPKLSLSGLAKQLEISPNQLSQIINQEAEVNFHDFVNSYRVEEFIDKANEKKNFACSLWHLIQDSILNHLSTQFSKSKKE